MLGALRAAHRASAASTRAASRSCRSAAPGHCTPVRWRDELGITRVLCPRASGVLCALGLAAAAPRHDISRTVLLQRRAARRRAPARAVRDALVARGRPSALAGERAHANASLYELRYSRPVLRARRRADRSRSIPPSCARRFAAAHTSSRYGYRDDEASTSSSSTCACRSGAPRHELRPRAGGETSVGADTGTGTGTGTGEEPHESARVMFAGSLLDARIVRGELAPGTIRVRPVPVRTGRGRRCSWRPHGPCAVDEHGTLHLLRDRDVRQVELGERRPRRRERGGGRVSATGRDRAAGRSPARCARPARRWVSR